MLLLVICMAILLGFFCRPQVDPISEEVRQAFAVSFPHLTPNRFLDFYFYLNDANPNIETLFVDFVPS